MKSGIKMTFEGFSRIESTVKYDTLHVDFATNELQFKYEGTVVGSLSVPRIDPRNGDTLTVTGLNGKIKVRLE